MTPTGASRRSTAPPGRGALEENQVRLIRQALERHQGHRARAAAELGIHRTTLWRKMRRYGITYPP